MWPESSESPRPLRSGLTTGTCATACCVATAELLLRQLQCTRVSVTLPRGRVVSLQVQSKTLDPHSAWASTIKDAGDDPDVTHGATVFVRLRLREQPGIGFFADEGVGTVTREGLLLDVGEPAINPIPRQMMSGHLTRLAEQCQYSGGFEVHVGVVNGAQLAQKTMNPRLGIVGGLSILGTTGVVRPFSCAAWIASIHQGLDVAAANGLTHVAASTGNASESAIQQHYQLSDMALIEMGDFAGAVLKHLRKTPQLHLSVCGGFGKLSKLAQGHLDLNSRASQIDFQHLADIARNLGATPVLVEQIQQANTALAVLRLCDRAGLPIANRVCALALEQAQRVSQRQQGVEIWAVDRQGNFIGHAGESA